MILTRISKYGFQVDNLPVWHNYLKSLDESKRFSKEDMGKEIDFRKDKEGRVVQIIILKKEKSIEKPNKEEKKKSLSIKVIECNDPAIFEGDLNDFASKNKVVATQTHVLPDKYIGVMFYE